MKNIRKLLLVTITSFMLTTSSVAVASEDSNDLDLLFGSSATQSMELASLSDAEMVATEGENWIYIGTVLIALGPRVVVAAQNAITTISARIGDAIKRWGR